MTRLANFRPLVAAGAVLGIGLGGFADGIFLHQVLQVHNMISNKRFPDSLANAEINMFWDGLFHSFTWTATLIGIYMLWRALVRGDVPRSGKMLIGSMIMGWGIFNLVEGIIDHHLLQIHHVMQRAPEPTRLYWDWGFLAVGGIFLSALGAIMIKHERTKITGMVTEMPSTRDVA